jgi:hypothetical protein
VLCCSSSRRRASRTIRAASAAFVTSKSRRLVVTTGSRLPVSRRARGDAVWRWSVASARAAPGLHGPLLRPDGVAAEAGSVQLRYSLDFR